MSFIFQPDQGEEQYNVPDGIDLSGGNPNAYSSSPSNMTMQDGGGNSLGSGLFNMDMDLGSIINAIVGAGATTAENAHAWTGQSSDKPVVNDFGQGDQNPKDESAMDKASGLLGKAGDWITKNPKASDTILGMIGGAYTADERRKAAEAQTQARRDEINLVHDNSVTDRNKYNASFDTTPRAKGGIIQSALKRIDGSTIFKNGSLRK